MKIKYDKIDKYYNLTRKADKFLTKQLIIYNQPKVENMQTLSAEQEMTLLSLIKRKLIYWDESFQKNIKKGLLAMKKGFRQRENY